MGRNGGMKPKSGSFDSSGSPAPSGFKVLTGHGASIDTTTSAGKLVFGIFASLA